MYLQFHSVKEPSKNHDIWIRVLFGSLRCRVRFGFFTLFTFGFGSVLGKIWELVRSVLAGFGFFPTSSKNGDTRSELCLL